MKRRKPVRKMMSEFSEELGVTAHKRNKMGIGLLVAAGGIVGYSLVRGAMNRTK
ncbi:hypothetical protein QBE55_03240 [Eubacteriales bacterium mix99]|jgi:hypothetical protein